MGLLGSVPWSLNCGVLHNNFIAVMKYDMLLVPSMDHLWRQPSNKLQVVMHHMWWSSPKSNSKIQHQKQSFLGKLYSIMAWKLTWMDSTECAEYSRGVFINNIAHIYVSTEAVWRARWINWKWTFSHEEMSISNLFSGAPTYCFRGHSFYMQIIQYYDMKLTWMDPVERAECSRSVFTSTILHIFTCPRKQYEGVHFQFIQRALHTASVDSNFFMQNKTFYVF